MLTENIDYAADGAILRGFLAFNESAGRRPGVLVFHEGLGLGDFAMEKARLLASLGYVAFAADMFGNRMQVTELPKAIETITGLLGNPPKLLARAGAALEVLRQRPEVDAAKRRHATRRRPTRAGILQHVQPAPQAVSAHRIPGPGQADPRRAPCPRLHLLGLVRGHAVLPARARAFVAGDLRRAAQ